VIGTAAMLAECSRVAITIDVTAVPIPPGVALDRWLQTFPSFGYLLAVAPANLAAVIARFSGRGIAVADIGAIEAGCRVSITDGRDTHTIRDLGAAPLILSRQSEPVA
jgi:selenophosphate synthetase-related protein